MCLCLQAADEPAYLTVGTDVSAKYRGAFCEAKIKTVKRLVKVKVRDLSESRMIIDHPTPVQLFMSSPDWHLDFQLFKQC